MTDGWRRCFWRVLQTAVGARLVLEPIVVLSYRRHLRTDRTPAIGYSAMRKLFGSPRASRLDELAEHSARVQVPLPDGDDQGLIRDAPDEVVTTLRRDGIIVLESRLPDELCAALVDLASSVPCDLTEPAAGTSSPERFDSLHPRAVRYDVPEAHLVESPAVQRLLSDRSMLAIAQAYLGGAPVQDLVAMWWTAASATSSSEAAQQFHFDLDRLRFLKLFVYLTDVGPENGPHEFIRGSHRSLPRPLRQDRRFSDAEVLAHFDARDIACITGEKGTMFLADTRGLHKGVNVALGTRLVFQLEYATSLFGAPVPEAAIHSPRAELVAAAAAFPATYRRFHLKN